jgi:4-amino-4-deoxy-L-arabinose transferase-like glycosyltransferase
MVAPRKTLLALLVVLALHLFLTLHYGRFQAVDEVFFKSAGREWAAHGKFAAPEVRGFRNLDPPVEVVWFAQLPLYTFLFGVFVKLFGFGATQSILYDALIHAALSLLVYALARTLAPDRNPWLAALAGALVIPLSTAGRPDELATAFGMCGLLALARDSSRARSLVISAVFVGLAGATSSVCAAIFVLIASALFLPREPLRFLLWCAGCVAVTFVVLTPFATIVPGAYRQYTSHAAAQFRPPWREAILNTWRYGKPYLFALAAALIAGVTTLRAGHSVLRRLWIALALSAAVLVLLFPMKYLYLSFLTMPALAVAAGGASASSRSTRFAFAAAACCFVVASTPFIKNALIITRLEPSQRLDPNVEAIRRLIPRGSSILGAEFWSSIGNDYDYRFRWSLPDSPSIRDIDYVIVTANGSGRAGVPQALGTTEQREVREHFVMVYDNLNRHASRLIGPLTTNSSWGFGARIYANERVAARHLKDARGR